MSVCVLVGRVLFVAIFLYSSIAHLTKTNMMAGYAKSKRVPLPWLATFVGGVFLLVGGVSVLLGIWADLGSLLLAAFLVPTAGYMHGFWEERGGGRMREQTQFLKDAALAGAALMLAGLISYAGHGLGFTLTGPLLHLH
jgi:uncharacterized membrane protein YphA (DoxX/SURF4 family)